MKTRITQLLNIKVPIVMGGMMHVGKAELAAAVSNAGALGTLTALNSKTPEDLAKEIKKLLDLTDKPVAVNLTLLPTLKPVNYDEYVRVVCESGIKIVETAGRSPQDIMPALKQADIKVIHKCVSVKHALKAEKLGVSIVSVDGFECAGHPGEDDIPNLVLLPSAKRRLKIPMIASGGIATGAQMAACLALGAEGVNMGTRFMATKEAPVHQRIKEALVNASEKDTTLILRSLNNSSRVFKNKIADEVVAIERQDGATDFNDLKDLVKGTRGREAMANGDVDGGIWSAGMVQGLIDDIPSCKELIDRMMRDCETVVKEQLLGYF